ncbi:MAG: hypothetical protein VKN13_01250 [Cyanobacteriota bacterium]|nr:hypothetical protein [Cyanobacteriota bacterium]
MTGSDAYHHKGCDLRLSQPDGGIGCMEAADVTGALQAAALTNAGGQTLRPDNASSREALAAIDLGPELTGSNPIRTVASRSRPSVGSCWSRALTVPSFTLSPQAQAMAPDLGDVSLPEAALEPARQRLAELKP